MAWEHRMMQRELRHQRGESPPEPMSLSEDLIGYGAFVLLFTVLFFFVPWSVDLTSGIFNTLREQFGTQIAHGSATLVVVAFGWSLYKLKRRTPWTFAVFELSVGAILVFYHLAPIFSAATTPAQDPLFWLLLASSTVLITNGFQNFSPPEIYHQGAV